jgi:hypothetical protein
MENKEAIEYLLYMKHDVQAGSPVDVAIDTAIEALKETAKKPKRNREKLMEQSLYDLLCSMNKRSMPHRCVLQLIDDKESARTRCDRYEGEYPACVSPEYGCCNQCIADYLNEYPF